MHVQMCGAELLCFAMCTKQHVSFKRAKLTDLSLLISKLFYSYSLQCIQIII